MANDADYEITDAELKDFCEVQSSVKIDNRTIFNMLINAFEGGINYWCNTIDAGDLGHVSASKRLAMGTLKSVKLRDEEQGKWVTLSQAGIRRGLHVMANKYRRHFQDMVLENDDADTADVFIQCAVFGESIYG